MPMQQAPQPDDRSLSELFTDLSRELTALVRQEVALAKTEMSDKAARAGRNAGVLAVGGAIAYAGLLALVAAAIIGLAHALAWWLSALIIGVLVVVIGVGLMWTGFAALRHADLVPHRTVQTLKEDAEWAKRQMT
jgi:xanthine/uracil permease